MVFVWLGWRYAAQVLLEDDSRWARSPMCGSLKARFVAAEGRGLLFYIHVCQLVPCVTDCNSESRGCLSLFRAVKMG